MAGTAGFDGFDGPLAGSPAVLAAGTAASPPSDDVPERLADPVSVVDELPSDAPSPPPPPDEADFTAVRRSRFAQPDPL
ncbi:MAG TPA: hypothetical protein VM408_01700 [Methylomirabilota bacterium]|nr:hypothetical protein [Methylomirabilota bacterium]